MRSPSVDTNLDLDLEEQDLEAQQYPLVKDQKENESTEDEEEEDVLATYVDETYQVNDQKLSGIAFESCFSVMDKTETPLIRIMCLVQGILTFFIAIAVQGASIAYFMIHQQEERSSADGEQCQTTDVLRALTLGIFLTSSMKELKEIGKLVRLLNLMNYCEEEFSYGARILAFCSVVVPKCIICFWLTYEGSQFLVHSDSDTDMLLNTLALGFILDIDELASNVFVYKFFSDEIGPMSIKICYWKTGRTALEMLQFVLPPLTVPLCIAFMAVAVWYLDRYLCSD